LYLSKNSSAPEKATWLMYFQLHLLSSPNLGQWCEFFTFFIDFDFDNCFCTLLWLRQCWLGVLILKWHQYHSKSPLKKISWSLYKNFLIGKMFSTETLILPVVIFLCFKFILMLLSLQIEYQ
jgi:hypothetical protein